MDMQAHPELGTPEREGLETFRMFIDGEFVEAASGDRFESTDPYTGKAWASLPDASPADVDRAVAAARRAFDGEWGRMSGAARARLLRKLAALIERDVEPLARMEVTDCGKLYRDMIGQVRQLPEWFYYHAGMADKLEGRTIPTDKDNFFVFTRREPIGVVAAITPWNAPLLLMVFKLAPALTAGCTFVIKPSEHASASTAAFARLVAEAGFPRGVFNVVTSLSPRVGAHLAGHPGVDKVLFTGSTRTGREVAKAAAANLNTSILELGGKSAQVVFEDADLDAAANGIVSGIFAASGQSCMAGSRLIVHQDVHDALVDRLVKRAQAIKLGDPQDPATEMGPISNVPQYEHVCRYLRSAQEEGARLLTGGLDREQGGLFVRPTVLVDVGPQMQVAREEVFGPVLCVFTFRDEEEAVRHANDSEYGLAASVWTTDLQRAHRLVGRIRAGTIWINSYRSVAPGVPFGGFGASGIGRENGMEAVYDFTETKAVWVELTGRTRDPFGLA